METAQFKAYSRAWNDLRCASAKILPVLQSADAAGTMPREARAFLAALETVTATLPVAKAVCGGIGK